MSERTFLSPKFGAGFGGLVNLPALGSIVCVANNDAHRSLDLNTCIIGRVTNIFRDNTGTCRCELKLYARPSLFPVNTEIGSFDLDEFQEVLEDCRSCVATISADTIFSYCKVIAGDSHRTTESIIGEYFKNQSFSSIRDSRPIFVCRFRLVEKESGGYMVQPLFPSAQNKMVWEKPEVLSETGTNVKDCDASSFRILRKPNETGSEAKENNRVLSSSEKLKSQRIRFTLSPEMVCRSTPHSEVPGTPRARAKRSLTSEFSGTLVKQVETECDSRIYSESSKAKLFCNTREDVEDSIEPNDLNGFSKTAWVSELMEMNGPGSRGTPIRLSLKRVRQDATPPQESPTSSGNELDEKGNKESCIKQQSLSKTKLTMESAENMDSGSDTASDNQIFSSRKRRKKSEINVQSDSKLNRRKSQRTSALFHKYAPQTAATKPQRSCKKVMSYKEILDDEKGLTSPDRSATPSASKTVRAQRSCKKILSYKEVVEDEAGFTSFEESRTPSSIKTPAKNPNRITRSSLKSRKLSAKLPSEDEEEDLVSSVKSKAHQTPKKTPKSTSERHTKSPRTPKVKTPSRTPSKKCFTPSMPVRASAPLTPSSSLEQIRKNLHVSAVPMSLPCRESEYRNICNFLENKIGDAAGGCMYISGVPGTGKTATVHAVIRSLKEKVEQKRLKEFQYIEVNGLRMTEPRQVFVQILKVLTGQKCTPQQAQDALAQRFCSGSSKNKTIVLLVDEVDMLRNRRQDVIYNLFDWPSKPNSRLIVLTIANTMDLPERLLKGRVTSRLGLTRLTFQPYSYKQLQEIVMSRLQGSNSFNYDAVELVSRKVAACSGDVRRALDICRRASELVEEGNSVSMSIVNKVLSQMMNSANVCSIKACSKLEKLFLQAIVAENERTGVEEATFSLVYRQFQSLCALSSVPLINISDAMAVLNRLGASGLLLTEHSKADLNQSVFLNVNADDVHYALNPFAVAS